MSARIKRNGAGGRETPSVLCIRRRRNRARAGQGWEREQAPTTTCWCSFPHRPPHLTPYNKAGVPRHTLPPHHPSTITASRSPALAPCSGALGRWWRLKEHVSLAQWDLPHAGCGYWGTVEVVVVVALAQGGGGEGVLACKSHLGFSP
ncbi:unnamed protein product [Arctogadus glacialis]